MHNRIIYLIFLFSICSFSCASRTDDIKNVLENTIAKHYFLYEVNPLYFEEAEQINSLFLTVLKQKKTLDDKKKREYIEMAAKIAYYESIAELEYVGYEDSPDERRIKMKYSIGNAIMALLSDYKQSMAHLQQAKEVLQKGSLLLDDKYAVVLLVELLIRYDNNKLNSNDVAITSNEVRALKDIPAETRNEINMLLLRLKSNKRLTTKSADMKNRPSDFS